MVGTIERRGLRWRRGLGRVLLLLIGAVQSLLGVMLGVGLVAAAFFYASDGPGLVASSILWLLVDLALLGFGLLALISALEDWEPPHDRWQGVRWPVLGLVSAAVTVGSWIAAALILGA